MTKKLKLLLEKNKYVKQVVLFIYSKTYGKHKKYIENKTFLLNAEEVLMEADAVFKELNINYWLDFGTLLGAIREGTFIKHDFDLDLGMYLYDHSVEIEQCFNKHGFKKIKDFMIDDGTYGREETYEYLGVQIDVFYYTQKTKKEAYYHDFMPLSGMSRDKTILELGGLRPREIILALEEITYIDFLGKQYPIPSPVKKHLSDRYGEDFMVENKSWSLGKEHNNNIKILINKVGIRHIYE